MSTYKRKLGTEEIRSAFGVGPEADYPPIISPQQLAHILGISVKTIYEWIAKGRLYGAFRKRGKRVLLWRDRAIEIIFNDKEWTNE